MIVSYENKFNALGVLCRELNNGPISRRKLDELMKTLGQCVQARCAALIRKRYPRRDRFIFELIAHWNVEQEEEQFVEPSVEHMQLEEHWWLALQARQPVIGDNCRFPPLNASLNVLLIPLFCNDILYGMLCFSDFESERIAESSVEFGLAAGNVFELWLTKAQSERRFAELIEFIPNPIMIIDTNGVATAWNQALEQMSGRPAEEILGKGNYEHAMPFYNERRPTASNLIFKPDPDIESQYLQFKRDGNTLSALARCDTLPGGGAFVASKTGVLLDATGRPSSSIHFIQDVTREREMAKNLRRSEAMYRTIIDFAGVGIVLFRGDDILYYNEHFAALIGITDRNITFRDFLSWIDPSEKEVVEFFNNPYEELKEPSRFEFRAQRENGGTRYYQGYARVVGYEDQAAIHFILDDISEQRQLAEKARINELRMHHEDRLTALGVMAAGIAHELNQPLNTTRVITDGILYGKDQGWELDEKELFGGLEMISRQVLRMSDVIQNIRDFAREDRGKCEMINPNDAIRNVFSMIGKQFEAHGIQIDMELEPRLPPLKSNVNNLEQVIMNLVVNARQALEEYRTMNKRLWLKTGFRYDQIFIEVGDNATGIPEDFLLNIFDPFFTTKEVGKGTGLGLSISQTIVSDFQGVLKAYNNKEGGATFFITAPATGDTP